MDRFIEESSLSMAINLSSMKLLALGYPVIPSGGGTSGKAPLVEWQRYQTEYPLPDDIVRWEEELKPNLWGIVTGAMSGVVIIDVDQPELRSIFDEVNLQPHIKTPRGGYHYWFKHPGTFVKTCAGILKGIDVRGDGGFVNVIGKRKDGQYETLFAPLPDSLYEWDKLPKVIANAMNGNGHKPEPKSTGEKIGQGQRNNRLASIAGSLHRQGLTGAVLLDALRVVNEQQCEPPLDDREVITIANSIDQKPENGITPTGSIKRDIVYTRARARDIICSNENERYESVTKSVTDSEKNGSSVTREKIEEWVRDTTGWWTYEELDRELDIRTPADKLNRRVAIKRLKDEGIVESHPKDNKRFRFINTQVRLIDFKSARGQQPIALKYPFGIERYYHTRPGNIIVVAGAADAGKTAFLLNIVRMNMFDFPIYYQSSEMGGDELASRLEKFDDIDLDEWNFTPEERSSNFQDSIRPDCVNIIDYMEFAGGEYYLIADYLKQIHDKLSTGVAIVAIQKKRGAEIGRGGEMGLEKPRLYLSMDTGKLTIQKCKNWAVPDLNPNRLIVNYKIVGGCKFIVTRDWFKDEAEV